MDYITVAQVVVERGVSVRSVHRKIRSGELPILDKIPGGTGAYLLDPAEVERVFKDRPINSKVAAA